VSESHEAAPQRWLALHLPVGEDPLLRERVVDLLLSGDLTQGDPPRGVEERDAELVVYLAPPSGGVGPLVEGIRSGLREAGAPLVAQGLRPAWQPHEAWADHWRRGFATRAVTDRITVTPSWLPAAPAPGGVVVVVDPGMAFGTSEHPTTRGCLRLLDPRITPGARVADVGAGSGVLAVAAALLGAREVVAVELDPWACAAARENVERNEVTGRVRVISKAVDHRFLPGEAPFDGIVANIETPLLRPLLAGFAGGLVPGGWLILSGILEGEAPLMTGAAAEAGFTLEAHDLEGEWWSGAFRGDASAGR
jgi:ribosomal protein L11 methyltransferase